jgi:L-cysteine:1D-myo-inositol 2-amino-2-deoxy-alpha-D-glucopyranoside ligase
LLWQAARPDEPAWDTRLGHGRPGWHIECTAIALEHLGMAFDVQGGGSDLTFPHHEMCASLAHVATGRWPFARRYVHAAMVGLGGHKMSKSRGNLVFVSRLLGAGWPAPAVRLALLEHHYRTDWEWEDGALDTAAARYERWSEATRAAVGPTAQGVLDDVRAALADDLDAPRALRVVDRWAERVRRGHGDDPTAPSVVADVVDALLGVDLHAPAVSRPGRGV